MKNILMLAVIFYNLSFASCKSPSTRDEYIEKIKCYKESFPVAEKAASSEGIIFHHSYLMGNDDDLQCIISAFKKVQKYAEEL